MRIAVLGTGTVGRALAGRLAERGHQVTVGTRDPQATLTRDDPDVTDWLARQDTVRLTSYADVAADAEVVVNATAGTASLEALRAAGGDRFAGTVVLDVANPLDFSGGFPPTLSVANTDSLAEQLQRAFPQARVVKALNTMNAQVMVDPGRLPGDHDVFLAGDDAAAKDTVRALLADLGWPAGSMIDLGGLRSARGAEMYLPLWLALMQATGTADFNVHVVRR